MLEIHHLTVRYGPVRALDDVTFSVGKGTITTVLGANGAGKTTLLRTISGLLKPSSGTISFAGREIQGRRAEDIARLGLAQLPEGQGVITELTVEENLRLGGLIAPAGPEERHEDLSAMYEMFPGLRERRSRPAATLSGGERQLMVIARALMSRPRALLLDEPSLGLAPRLVVQIMAVLRRLRDDMGRTVVLVEQNARSALSIADRVVVLNLGRAVMDEDAAELAGDQRLLDRLRQAYLGF